MSRLSGSVHRTPSHLPGLPVTSCKAAPHTAAGQHGPFTRFPFDRHDRVGAHEAAMKLSRTQHEAPPNLRQSLSQKIHMFIIFEAIFFVNTKIPCVCSQTIPLLRLCTLCLSRAGGLRTCTCNSEYAIIIFSCSVLQAAPPAAKRKTAARFFLRAAALFASASYSNSRFRTTS